MAAVSGSRTSIVTTNGSSSRQVQLAQSSHNAPAPNATKPTPLATSNNKLRPGSIGQSYHPAPSQAMDRPSSTSTGSSGNHGALSTLGFGTSDLNEPTSNPLLESILRPNKDGRVKNPVPSKLKGKTDIKKGNFSVMHMGTTPGKRNDAGKDAAAERDAAARRTSENTASRAKAAQQEKYMPPRRRGLEAESASNIKVASPFTAFTPSRDEQKPRARPLAPDETKFEQARLLTLLRSINPITVVDQICKGVAYFGGIPGAPPPDDGIFPESASTKETGALFIGWLAEIFPDLSSHGGHAMHNTPGGSQNQLSLGAQMPPMNGAPNSSNGFGYGQAVSAPVWGLSPAPPATNSQGPGISPEAGQLANAAPAQNNPPEQPHQETPGKQSPPEGPPPSTSTSKRGRGRPKGSRNKGKSDAQNIVEAAASSGPAGPDSTSQNHPLILDQSQDSPIAVGPSGEGSKSGAAQLQPVSDQPGGTKQAARYAEPSWQINAQKPQAEPTSGALPTTVDELSPEERAVLEAFRQQDASEAGKASPLNSAVVQGTTATGLKRKRPTPKTKSVAGPLSQPSEQTQSTPHIGSSLIPSNDASMSIPGGTLDWSSVDTSTPSVPAAKRQRQRKPKPPGGSEPPRSQTASVASNTTPPIATHPVPDSTSTPSLQVQPPRPPAEGLEAHYEKFASRPQQLGQQNGTTHTPSAAQQQLRQQQKPMSVVPQQKQAPAPQQQQKPAAQVQQQKPQQGSQRDNQKATQGSSARPSSTGFYNQRGHGAFTHQYPSSQTSQLYGTHQSSPQINSGSNSSNSFRAANAHSLGQGSAQFSQGDAYRTSSPRTISQSSPTFSQADNSFRSTSSHNIPQPSPTYGQAEKIYRTSNTQPSSSSFSRSHNQPQQSHQSHYTHFTENPYADLPTLDSLGNAASTGHPAVSLSSGSFGQNLPTALSTSSRASTSSLFGTASPSVFDPAPSADHHQQQQLLRAQAASRPQPSSGVYGTSSNLGSGFEPSPSDQELRERLMRNIGRR